MQADIIRACLVDQQLVIMPGNPQTPGDGTVQCFVSSMPDDIDQLVCIYDVSGIQWGRLQSGKRLIYPGIKVLVRHLYFPKGDILTQNIANGLDAIASKVVMVNGTTHYIKTVTRRGTINFIGEEPAKRRSVWSINATVAFQDQEPVMG